MATYKNPLIIIGGTSNPALTCTTTLVTPKSVKSYLDTMIASIPDVATGKYYVINTGDWTLKNDYTLMFFCIQDGVIKSDAGARLSGNCQLTACAWTAEKNLRIDVGNVFEFIKAA